MTIAGPVSTHHQRERKQQEVNSIPGVLFATDERQPRDLVAGRQQRVNVSSQYRSDFFNTINFAFQLVSIIQRKLRREELVDTDQLAFRK